MYIGTDEGTMLYFTPSTRCAPLSHRCSGRGKCVYTVFSPATSSFSSSCRCSESTGSNCQSCPLGKVEFEHEHDVARVAPMLSCRSCPTGYHSETLGFSATGHCKTCQPGRKFTTIATDCLDCDAGMYQSEEAKPFCLPCIPGKFQTESKTSACKNCEKNTQAENVSSTKCVGCPTGWSSDSASAKCQACEAGSYATNEGDECEPCGAGKYRQSKQTNDPDKITNPTFCVGCPTGWSSDEGSTKCQPCEAGTFSDIQGKICQPCAKGKYRQSKETNDDAKITNSTFCVGCPTGWSSEEGSTKCQACGAGTYGAGCNPCEKGTYRNGSDPITTSCRKCSTGYYSDDVGQGSCLPCIPGEYNAKVGAINCTSCQKDSYSTLKHRNTPCDSCAQGRTSDRGSTKCSVCAAGKILNLTTNGCSDCVEGEYRGGADEITKCKMCLPGFYTDEPGQGSCLPCIPGEFNDVAGAMVCEPCQKNTFSTDKNRKVPCDSCATGRTSDPGSTKCSSCAPGKYVETLLKIESCTECPIGWAQGETDQKQCVQCSVGQEATATSSSTCSNCDLGKYNSVGGDNCVACPVGQYQDDKGKTECKDCSKDRYGIVRFETEGKKRKGATSNAECNEWQVEDVFFCCELQCIVPSNNTFFFFPVRKHPTKPRVVLLEPFQLTHANVHTPSTIKRSMKKVSRHVWLVPLEPIVQHTMALLCLNWSPCRVTGDPIHCPKHFPPVPKDFKERQRLHLHWQKHGAAHSWQAPTCRLVSI